MFVVDTNLLLYAVNPDSTDHPAARLLVAECRRGDRLCFLTWSSIYEFLRVSTHHKVFPQPLDLRIGHRPVDGGSGFDGARPRPITRPSAFPWSSRFCITTSACPFSRTHSMKQRHILTAVFCALTFASSAHAQTPEQGPSTPLGEQMKLINAAYRALNPLITAGSADSAMAKVVIIHKAAEEALKFEPARKADTPVAEQEKFVTDFRRRSRVLLATSRSLQPYMNV